MSIKSDWLWGDNKEVMKDKLFLPFVSICSYSSCMMTPLPTEASVSVSQIEEVPASS